LTDDNLRDLLESLQAFLLARIPVNHANNPARLAKLANAKLQPMSMVSFVCTFMPTIG
jgi:hypothetical protein